MWCVLVKDNDNTFDVNNCHRHSKNNKLLWKKDWKELKCVFVINLNWSFVTGIFWVVDMCRVDDKYFSCGGWSKFLYDRIFWINWF